jgi:hypothetical protein
MFDFGTLFSQMPNYYEAEIINTKGWMLFALAAIITFAPLSSTVNSVLNSLWAKCPAKLIVRSVAALILLGLSVVSMAESGFSPFLYYQF